MSALGFGTLANKRRPFYSPGGSPVPPGPPGPPNRAPSIPAQLEDSTTTSITVFFDVAGITGSTPLLYNVLYGTQALPSQAFPAVLVSGTIYKAVVTGLTPNTEYFFKSAVRNIYGDKVSEQSDGIFTGGGSGTPISGPPTVPTLVNADPDTITVAFDATGITGSPPLTYKIYYGTTSNPVAPVDATLVSGNIYNATAVGLLPNTRYYFKSVVNNDVDIKLSAVSAPFSTDPTPAGLTKLISGNGMTMSPISGNGVVTVNAFNVVSNSTARAPTSGGTIQASLAGGAIPESAITLNFDAGPTPISGFVIFNVTLNNNLNSPLSTIYGLFQGSGPSATIIGSNNSVQSVAGNLRVSVMYPIINVSGPQTVFGFVAQLAGPLQPGQQYLNPSITVMTGGLATFQTS
jgi:hypothetical protein